MKKERNTTKKYMAEVRDILYLVDFEFGIFKCIVDDIQISKNNEPIYRLCYYSQNGNEPAKFEWDTHIANHNFGKTVFFTKKEAEAKLKELREDEQFKLYYASIVNNEH